MIKMMVAFGVAFQFPIALIALQAVGLITNHTLRNNRSYALICITILVAVITPSGDPFTLLALTVPMYAFYEISILYGMITQRRHMTTQRRHMTTRLRGMTAQLHGKNAITRRSRRKDGRRR